MNVVPVPRNAESTSCFLLYHVFSKSGVLTVSVYARAFRGWSFYIIVRSSLYLTYRQGVNSDNRTGFRNPSSLGDVKRVFWREQCEGSRVKRYSEVDAIERISIQKNIFQLWAKPHARRRVARRSRGRMDRLLSSSERARKASKGVQNNSCDWRPARRVELNNGRSTGC